MRNEVTKVSIIDNYDEESYVYDISLDGTVINAFGMNVAKQTDGFNFQMPPQEELDKRVYIGQGKNRNTKKGKEYHGVEADVAEFNDLFMERKMGLGIDEYADATINFSRKNYADLLENDKTKLVGNTIKSKKMPQYIENFINEGVNLLLHNNGYQFLQNYYNYIDKIYNLKIPLREIASKGKVKKTIEEYIKDCGTVTSAGQKKSRQAWYELILKNNIKTDIGETIYYINTGKKSSHSDIKRVTHYYVMEGSDKIEISKELDKAWTAYRKECKKNNTTIQFKTKLEFAHSKYKTFIEEDELIFNSELLPNEIVEAENDTFCSDDMEYNVEKYIDQFNKRIKPLLVCFSKEIRDAILIKTPDNKQYFREEQSLLVSNEPNTITDQDTYDQLMTMEDKEIKFWLKMNTIPPFVEECGMDWEEIKLDYIDRMKQLEEAGIKDEIIKYQSIIDNLTKKDIDNFITNGNIPSQILTFINEDVNSNNFISKQYNIVIGSIYDILDKEFVDKNLLDKNEEKFNNFLDSSNTPESDEVIYKTLGVLKITDNSDSDDEDENND